MQVDSLELEIKTNADAAANSINNLRASLKGIRSACTSYAKGLDRINESLKRLGGSQAQQGLQDTADAMRDVSAQSADASEKLGKAKDKVKETGDESKKSASKLSIFFKQLKRIAVYRLIRTVLKTIANTLKEGVNNVALYDKAMGNMFGYNTALSELTTEWTKLKNTLGVFTANIISAITPALVRLMQVVYTVVDAVDALIAAFKGQSSYLAVNPDYWKDYASSLDSSNSSAKKLKRTLLGFDELNVLSDDSSSGSSSSVTDMFQEKESPSGSIIDTIKENITEITAYLSDSALAIGAILLFTGNIPLGLGLMALGAIGWAEEVTPNFDTLTDAIQERIVTITSILGMSLFAIGAILAFTGANIPLGLGLIAAGAASLVTTASLDWDSLSDNVKSKLKELLSIISGSLLVIGAILTLTGNLPLGLALIATGVAGFVTVAAIDWDALKTKLSEAWESIKKWFNDSVKPKLTVSYWSNIAKNVLEGLSNKLNTLKEKLSSVWESVKKWFNDSVKPKFTLEYWANFGKNIIEGILSGLKEKYQSLKSWVEEHLDNLGGNSSTSSLSFSSDTAAKVSTSLGIDSGKYASGGTPDTGSLFWAGEAGPELVTQVGGKSTVYNEDQLGSSLEYANEAVVQAVLASANAMVSAINSKNMSVELDGATVSRQLYKSLNNESSRRGTSLVQGV